MVCIETNTMVLIFDGMNFLYRSQISFGNNSASGGDYYMIFNFFRNLRATIGQFSPTKVYFAMEGHPQFRYDLYPEYKANRKAAHKKEGFDKFLYAKEISYNLLKSFPITICKSELYEADDTISSLAKFLNASNPNEEIVIITSDNDYIQLISPDTPNIKVYSAMKKTFLTYSKNFLEMKSLMGDKSDNIKGCMGEVKAAKVCQDDKLLKQAIETNKDIFERNMKLVKFQEISIDNIVMMEGVFDVELIKSEFERMEFKTILAEAAWKKFVDTFMSLVSW